MNYPLARRRRRRNPLWLLALAALAILLVVGGNALIRHTGQFGQSLGKPFWQAGDWIRRTFRPTTSFFASKAALRKENDHLKQLIREKDAMLADRSVLERENEELKGVLGRTDEREYVLAPIMVRPNRSAYDTLIVDAPPGVEAGQLVFAAGNVLIGRVSETYEDTAKITLFSSPGEKIVGLMGENNIEIELIGKGAGNFELRLPREVAVVPGAEISIPSIAPNVIALVGETISDPRDPFQKVLAKSPVNIFQMKWVQIRK